MKARHIPAIVFATGALSLLSGMAPAAPDKYTVKIPDGLELSEVEGYETWEVVSVSRSSDENGSDATLNVIVANPTMIKAYVAGIPGNGERFPNDSKIVKMRYVPKQSSDAPANVEVPDRLRDIVIMVKDSRRFAGTGGWGYGRFDHSATTDAFMPNGTGTDCGASCHAAVKAKDYIFTRYEKK